MKAPQLTAQNGTKNIQRCSERSRTTSWRLRRISANGRSSSSDWSARPSDVAPIGLDVVGLFPCLCTYLLLLQIKQRRFAIHPENIGGCRRTPGVQRPPHARGTGSPFTASPFTSRTSGARTARSLLLFSDDPGGGLRVNGGLCSGNAQVSGGVGLDDITGRSSSRRRFVWKQGGRNGRDLPS